MVKRVRGKGLKWSKYKRERHGVRKDGGNEFG